MLPIEDSDQFPKREEEVSEEDLRAIGRFRWKRPPSPYESFIEEEKIPIIRGLGIYDVRELALGPWERMGGTGAYLELDGLHVRRSVLCGGG